MAHVRGRFAPSPTGLLHLGSARTALVAWLSSRKKRGEFVLRVEDLDTPRVVPGALHAMVRDLKWLGLDWDEGPDRSGPFAPYIQSQRVEHYRAALRDLVARDLVYPCTCSRKEIASIASAPHGPDDEGPRYPGTCRNGPTHPERAPCYRFRMPQKTPVFEDILHGTVSQPDDLGDFVVCRADGIFAYQFAVVVDDLAMDITEVVRADDLLSSTPKQIALIEALGGKRPNYLHVPLMLGDDGVRLSKRHASTAIAERRELGESAHTVLGKLAASLNLIDGEEAISAEALIAVFDPSRLSTHST